jgi:hypothetical protein
MWWGRRQYGPAGAGNERQIVGHAQAGHIGHGSSKSTLSVALAFALAYLPSVTSSVAYSSAATPSSKRLVTDVLDMLHLEVVRPVDLQALSPASFPRGRAAKKLSGLDLAVEVMLRAIQYFQ